MEQEVYIDLYFLVNAGMDFLCLMMTAALLHKRPRRLRVLAGATVGGLYACLSLLFGPSGLWGVALDLLAVGLCCALTFGLRDGGGRGFLKAVGIQLPVSALMGGTMTLLFSLLNRLKLPLGSLERDGLSAWVFALLALLSGLFTLRGGRLLGRSHRLRTVTLEAVLFGKSVTLRAMVDSGNLLRDPVSGRSVVVADTERLRGVLPPALLAEAFPTDHALVRRLRLIPIQTAAGEGILRAVLPDSLTVVNGKTRETVDHLIAFTRLEGKAEGCDALFPPS